MIKKVPNILSVIRILMVPLFIAVYFNAGQHARIWAATVYALASFTDVLDGHIARKYNATSNLGRILDPLGDKLMCLSVLGCLASDGIIPMWALVLVAMKEILMITGGALIHEYIKVDMPASNILGKLASAVLFVFGVVLLVFDVPKHISDIMIAAVVSVVFMAFGSYALAFIAMIKNKNSHRGEIDKE